MKEEVLDRVKCTVVYASHCVRHLPTPIYFTTYIQFLHLIHIQIDYSHETPDRWVACVHIEFLTPGPRSGLPHCSVTEKLLFTRIGNITEKLGMRINRNEMLTSMVSSIASKMGCCWFESVWRKIVSHDATLAGHRISWTLIGVWRS